MNEEMRDDAILREWVWYSGGVGYPMACERRRHGALSREIAAYEGMRDWLEMDYFGKWVVVHDEELVGTYETFSDAADVAVRRFGRGPYLIRRVGAGPPKVARFGVVSAGLMARAGVRVRGGVRTSWCSMVRRSLCGLASAPRFPLTAETVPACHRRSSLLWSTPGRRRAASTRRLLWNWVCRLSTGRW